MPMPPWPRARTISYRPAKRVPGERSTATTTAVGAALTAVGGGVTSVAPRRCVPQRAQASAAASLTAWQAGQFIAAGPPASRLGILQLQLEARGRRGGGVGDADEDD